MLIYFMVHIIIILNIQSSWYNLQNSMSNKERYGKNKYV